MAALWGAMSRMAQSERGDDSSVQSHAAVVVRPAVSDRLVASTSSVAGALNMTWIGSDRGVVSTLPLSSVRRPHSSGNLRSRSHAAGCHVGGFVSSTISVTRSPFLPSQMSFFVVTVVVAAA